MSESDNVGGIIQSVEHNDSQIIVETYWFGLIMSERGSNAMVHEDNNLDCKGK